LWIATGFSTTAWLFFTRSSCGFVVVVVVVVVSMMSFKVVVVPPMLGAMTKGTYDYKLK
jgi:hypothetical protein